MYRLDADIDATASIVDNLCTVGADVWGRWVAVDVLSERDAEQWIFDNAFSTDRVGRIGLELEWFVVNKITPTARVMPETVRSLTSVDDRLSFEPGGQLELSTAPAERLAECLITTGRDIAELRGRLQSAGLDLVGTGLDLRPPERVVRQSRYAALEAHYRRYGHIGHIMMCNTASVQVNIDSGDDSTGWRGRQRRWWLANSLGPVFVAMFANSPQSHDAHGRSCRQVLRFHTDRSRTDPIALSGDCRVAWARYALDANVIGVATTPAGQWVVGPPHLTMRRWLRGAGPRPPTIADLRQHLKAVIPPVRACGHLELRMIDAQDDDDWVVPATVISVLLDDRKSAELATGVAAGMPAPEHCRDWILAAQTGLSQPQLAAAAHACMKITLDALDRLDMPAWAQQVVAEFAERYTFQGLCPADAPRRECALRLAEEAAVGQAKGTPWPM